VAEQHYYLEFDVVPLKSWLFVVAADAAVVVERDIVVAADAVGTVVSHDAVAGIADRDVAAAVDTAEVEHFDTAVLLVGDKLGQDGILVEPAGIIEDEKIRKQ